MEKGIKVRPEGKTEITGPIRIALPWNTGVKRQFAGSTKAFYRNKVDRIEEMQYDNTWYWNIKNWGDEMITLVTCTPTLAILEFSCNINISTVGKIKEYFHRLGDMTFTELVMDFSKVEIIDSIGVGFILNLYKEYHKINRSIRIQNVNANIKHLFKLIGVDKLMSVQ